MPVYQARRGPREEIYRLRDPRRHCLPVDVIANSLFALLLFKMAHVLNQPAGDCASSRATPRHREHGHHGGGHHQDYWHRTRKLILCFDGTGNKFHGDDSDSNILKIFRMLDSSASDQCKCSAGPNRVGQHLLTSRQFNITNVSNPSRV